MKALIFDTETTGLITRGRALDKQPEIVEFYAAVYNLKTGKKTAEYWQLIKPRLGSIPEVTSKIHGIWDKDVAKSPTFDKVAKEIKSIIEKSPIVIAHNAAFDRDMVNLEFERLGEKVKWKRVICTIEQTMHVKGHRLSLSNLHEHLMGEKFEGAHRANVDVAALARCATKLYSQGAIA